jgi:hypothetical protein
MDVSYGRSMTQRPRLRLSYLVIFMRAIAQLSVTALRPGICEAGNAHKFQICPKLTGIHNFGDPATLIHPERTTSCGVLMCASGWVRRKHLEVSMTTVKSLAIIALLVGGTSLALAQTPPTTGGSPAGGVVNTPGGPGYASGQTGQPGHATKHKKMHMSANGSHHKKMHMSANGNHHKNMYMSTKTPHHKTLKTGQPQPKQP